MRRGVTYPRAHPGRGREDRVDEVAGVPEAYRHEQHDLSFRLGDRTMLDASRHDNKIARIQLHRPIAELQPETPPQQRNISSPSG